MKMNPVTDQEFRRVKYLRLKKYSRNKIARIIERSPTTVGLLLKSDSFENYQWLQHNVSLMKQARRRKQEELALNQAMSDFEEMESIKSAKDAYTHILKPRHTGKAHLWHIRQTHGKIVQEPVPDDIAEKFFSYAVNDEQELDPPDFTPIKGSLHEKLDLILRYVRAIHTAKNLPPIE